VVLCGYLIGFLDLSNEGLGVVVKCLGGALSNARIFLWQDLLARCRHWISQSAVIHE